MTETSVDGADALVRGLVEALSDSGESTVPAASTDAEEVIKSQLTENTGAHLLDSGGVYGRNWEENQDNPPWEKPAWKVDHGVLHNVYHFMSDTFSRDTDCVALEAALYAYAYSDDRKRDAWLRCMEDFAEGILNQEFSHHMLTSLGVSELAAERVVGLQVDLADRRGEGEAFTVNTYNFETHPLSQILQGTNLGGPYAEYSLIQVHGGADVRGGYTAPRVYQTWDGWVPHELWFHCERCDWDEAESCIYGEESLHYQRSIDPFELEDEGLIEEGDEEHPALAAAYEAEESGYQSGAVFHDCEGPIGNLGHVRFS